LPPATPLIQAPLDRLRYLRELQSRASRIKRGVARYYDDPLGFAADCIDWRGGGLKEYQQEIIGELPSRKREAVRGPHTLGKALHLNVRIPTPSGWSTIGDLRPGDRVFDEAGRPCSVVAKSPVWHGDTYEVEFADGTVITAHGQHEWNAVDVYTRPRTPRPERRRIEVSDWRDHWANTKCVTTAYMAQRLRTRGGQLRWRIPVASALELPEADLPVDPYLFGYWLGDGTSSTAAVTVHSGDWPSLQGHLARAGYHHGTPRPHKERPVTLTVGISTQPLRRGGSVAFKQNSMAGRLRTLGVLGNKHIPGVYKRASAAQRIELVRGLMDSDGYRQAGDGSDEISLSCELLALDFAEVLRSLGLVVRVSESDSKLYGRVVGRRWRIAARFDFNPYHLKRYNWKPRGRAASRHTQRTITDIRKVADQPTQCIEVDSPSHLYLAGDSMVPTHNSTIAAVTVLWFALTRDAAGTDWKVATTAGSWMQLTRYLWPEIHKWSGRLRWDKVRDGRPFTRQELQNLNLRLNHGAAFAGASANSALIEGAHADSLLFVYDEAKAIPAGTFDACEGALGGTGEALALTLSTPGSPAGRFYDICTHRPGYEDWHPVHITLERAIAAGQVDEAWADQRARQWGTQSAIYVNRVLGEFHAGDEDSVIPLAWAEAAVLRWHEWDLAGRPDGGWPRTVGVDVARSGSDKTVLAPRQGPVITGLRRSVKEDTMQTTGRVKGVVDADNGRSVPVVDVIGIGAGVVDRLREQEYTVEAFNASARCDRLDATGELGFANVRSGAWWSVRELLDPSSGSDICLPDDDMLLGDLSAPQWKVLSGGKIQVESKDEIVKRLGRSTDDGDAVVQALWPRSTPHQPNARQYALQAELDQMTRPSDPRHRRAAQQQADYGQRDDGWGVDSFAPQDDDGRPSRPNVHSWR
jgi:hypothetical protein